MKNQSRVLGKGHGVKTSAWGHRLWCIGTVRGSDLHWIGMGEDVLYLSLQKYFAVKNALTSPLSILPCQVRDGKILRNNGLLVPTFSLENLPTLRYHARWEPQKKHLKLFFDYFIRPLMKHSSFVWAHWLVEYPMRVMDQFLS